MSLSEIIGLVAVIALFMPMFAIMVGFAVYIWQLLFEEWRKK